MGKKVITPLMVLTGLFIISSAFAQPTEKRSPGNYIQKSGPVQTPHKIATIDASMLQKIRTPLSRPTAINALMGNPVTRGMLESSARNARVQVKELPSKGLDGKMISGQPKGRTIDQLNWNAGIVFSLVNNHPKYFDPTDNKEKPLGYVRLGGVFLESSVVSQLMSTDIFQVNPGQTGGSVGLALFLPPSTSSYMIGVQGSPTSGAEMTILDSNNLRKLDAFPVAGGAGALALTAITPKMVSKSVGRCDIWVRPGPNGFNFGIFVITRL
jgi:hypothetical protein